MLRENVTPARRPVVGISCYDTSATWGDWTQPVALVPSSYLNAVVDAGGDPVLLAVLPAEHADQLVARIDALVLAGGADVEPSRYGAVREPACGPTAPERDAWELALLESTQARNLPVLAICRGLQLLNVARGGTLVQHLPAAVGHEGHSPGPAAFGAREVVLSESSRLHTLLGDRVAVPCHHHQAVDRLGSGLRCCATDADGTIEAIEDPSRAFVVGVQWHVEASEDRRLFRALVECAATRQPREEVIG